MGPTASSCPIFIVMKEECQMGPGKVVSASDICTNYRCQRREPTELWPTRKVRTRWYSNGISKIWSAQGFFVLEQEWSCYPATQPRRRCSRPFYVVEHGR